MNPKNLHPVLGELVENGHKDIVHRVVRQILKREGYIECLDSLFENKAFGVDSDIDLLINYPFLHRYLFKSDLIYHWIGEHPYLGVNPVANINLLNKGIFLNKKSGKSVDWSTFDDDFICKIIYAPLVKTCKRKTVTLETPQGNINLNFSGLVLFDFIFGYSKSTATVYLRNDGNYVFTAIALDGQCVKHIVVNKMSNHVSIVKKFELFYKDYGDISFILSTFSSSIVNHNLALSYVAYKRCLEIKGKANV